MFIPDPRWEEPNLLIPGKKPTGPVTIDWSHPLARGLRFVHGVAPYRNIVTGKGGDIVAYDTGTVSIRPGRDYYFDGSSGLVISSANSLHNGDIGIFAIVTPSAFGSERQIVASDSSGAGKRDFQFRFTSTGYLQFIPFVSNSPITVTSASTYSAGAKISVCATYDSSYASGNIRVFANGVLSGSGNGTGSLDADNPDTGIGSRYNISDATELEPFLGTVHFVAIWDRAIADAEVAEISRNPYCFLIPA